MIPLEALVNVKTIIAHDACSDGTASALLLHFALQDEDGPRTKVRFVQYGTDAHRNMVAEPGLLFCDFSPPADRVAEFVAAGAIVLDHHATAKPVVEAFGERGVFGDEKADPGVSGAVLAYRLAWEGAWKMQWLREEAGEFARLAGIRDTWQRQSPDWVAACKQAQVLAFAPNTFWMKRGLHTILKEWEDTWAPIGEILYDRQQKEVEKAAARAWRFTTAGGLRVAVLTSKGLISDVAEHLGQDADLVVGTGFAYEPGVDSYPKMIVSTRSRGSFDCGAFCKRFEGGGGHTKAAGFSVQLDAQSPDPFRLIERLVRFYEASL